MASRRHGSPFGRCRTTHTSHVTITRRHAVWIGLRVEQCGGTWIAGTLTLSCCSGGAARGASLIPSILRPLWITPRPYTDAAMLTRNSHRFRCKYTWGMYTTVQDFRNARYTACNTNRREAKRAKGALVGRLAACSPLET